jgi:L-methionine (R)-S-oxide reductase
MRPTTAGLAETPTDASSVTRNESDLTRELVEASARGGDSTAGAARIAAAIRRFGGYRWVGVYDLGPEEISVIGWDGPGPPAHPRFARTSGLCGAAIAARRTVVVGDTTADTRYLTTHPTTRSEIVVPVFSAGAPVGLIDVESESPQAFGEDDERLLEHCAALIAPLWRRRAFEDGPRAG